MADTILIHFDPANDQHNWSTVNDAGELTSKIESGSLQQFAEQHSQGKVVVLLDNTAIHMNNIAMPAMSQQKLLKAIPFALEDQLADDVEDMHFVFSRDDKDGPVSVAAIARDTLQNMLDRFEEIGVKPAAILPDSTCLAGNAEQWCALYHDDQVNLQSGSFIGNEYDRDLFDTILTAELQQSSEQPKRLFVFTLDGEEAADVSAITGDDIEIVNVSYNTHPLVVYCGNYQQAMPLNLLQHEFKPVSSGGIAWRRWSIAAGLALVWLSANMGVSAWELQQLKAENDELNAQSVSLYRKTFPKSKRIVNPRVQMEQKLKELKSGAGASSGSIVRLIANSAPALSQDSSIELKSLSYRNGRLDITINTKNLNSIQSLNTRLNEIAGISSEIISSSSEKNTVTGSLRIKQAAS